MEVGRVEDIDDLELRCMVLEQENSKLRQRLLELEKERKNLIRDLVLISAKFSDADDRLRRWRTELDIVASKEDHNQCHVWIPELLERTLGHAGKFPDPNQMTREQFERGCREYQDCIFGPKVLPLYSGEMFEDNRAVFIDRDGVLVDSIIRSPDFGKSVTAPFCEDELRVDPDAYNGLMMLQEAGFLRIMVTNQPDVAHNYLDQAAWRRIHYKVLAILGSGLNAVKMCRHRTEDNCPRKKPSPKMLYEAAEDRVIDLPRSWMIGDTLDDMRAGRRAGCRVILIDKPYNRHLESQVYDHRVSSFMAAVKIILGKQE